MRVALTLFMFSMNVARHAALVLVAVSSLLGVACSGGSEQPTYTATDVELNAADATAVVGEGAEGCTTGETKSCTIFLGRHGDLANCVKGLDVCSAGEWTGCVDEASFSENPELMSQLVGE
jgi:hypothetical protein